MRFKLTGCEMKSKGSPEIMLMSRLISPSFSVAAVVMGVGTGKGKEGDDVRGDRGEKNQCQAISGFPQSFYSNSMHRC